MYSDQMRKHGISESIIQALIVVLVHSTCMYICVHWIVSRHPYVYALCYVMSRACTMISLAGTQGRQRRTTSSSEVSA